MKTPLIPRFLLPTVLSMSFFSCGSVKKEALTPGCDATMFYSTDIHPILESKCLTCHSSTFTYMSGPDLSDYSLLKAQVDNGHFRDRVFTRKDMPMAGYPSLTDSELGKLRCWLDQGARNN